MRECLGVLSKIHYGKSPNEVLSEDGGIPIIGTGGVYGQANRALFPEGIVVARKGSLGTPHLLRSPFWPVDTTYAVIPNQNVDIAWLYYCLLNFDLTKLNEATGVPSINRSWLAKVAFCNPGFDQQRKIAAILSGIDTAIEKTEALIEKYQQIKAGLMHDLFTRGVLPNGQLRSPREQAPELYRETAIGWIPRDWGISAVEELLAPIPNNIRSGPFGSALLKSELVEGGIPLLGIDNIHVERFDQTFRRFVSQRKFQELARYSVRPKDVVITIMGTVGRSCVLPDDIGEALSSKHLWTMSFDVNKVLPDLVCWQLNHSSWAKAWFRRAAQGGVMDAIQSQTLKSLRLPVPSTEEQDAIEERYSALSQRIQRETDSCVKLRAKKLGLMQDLLTGKVQVKVAAETAELAVG